MFLAFGYVGFSVVVVARKSCNATLSLDPRVALVGLIPIVRASW